MKVQQLFLRNVRSIKSLDLDFRDPVTGKPMSRIVLAGANGSGKTTILESIFGLMAAAPRYHEAKLEIPYFFLAAQLQILFEIELLNRPLTILSISYGNDIPIKPSAYSEGKRIKTDPRQLYERTSRYDYLEIDLGPDAEETSAFAQLLEAIRSAIMRDGEAPGSVLYFPHNRYLPSVPQGELGFEPKIYEWAYRYQPADQWKGSTESYLFSLNYLDLEDRDRKMPANRFGQTIELVNSILVDKKITHIEKGRVVIETASGETHGLSELSSGEKHLVLLLIEITRRIVPGSVILIDEPEISLHPAWQRGLVAALDKIIEQYDAQVIMATHSLEIAGMVQPHEVLFLSDLGVPPGEWKPEREVLA
jgi:predicted ATPase